MLNITPLNRGRRAREGSEQGACCGLERDKEPARQRRQRQGPEVRASEGARARRAREGSEQRARRLEVKIFLLCTYRISFKIFLLCTYTIHRISFNRERARERRQHTIHE